MSFIIFLLTDNHQYLTWAEVLLILETLMVVVVIAKSITGVILSNITKDNKMYQPIKKLDDILLTLKNSIKEIKTNARKETKIDTDEERKSKRNDNGTDNRTNDTDNKRD